MNLRPVACVFRLAAILCLMGTATAARADFASAWPTSRPAATKPRPANSSVWPGSGWPRTVERCTAVCERSGGDPPPRQGRRMGPHPARAPARDDAGGGAARSGACPQPLPVVASHVGIPSADEGHCGCAQVARIELARPGTWALPIVEKPLGSRWIGIRLCRPRPSD